MPKGHQRSNREAKKPKQPKKAVVPAGRPGSTPLRQPIVPPGKKV
jgi:hypothetical protein